jgi:penicillin-binding protein 2
LTHDYRQRKEFLDYRREESLRTRMLLLQAILGALFLVYLGSLWFFQIVRADHYRERSDSNRIRTFTVSPLRGLITDRRGRLLAKNRPSFILALEVARPVGWNATRQRLAEIVGADAGRLEERRRRGASVPGIDGIVIQENVDLEQAAYIESHPEEFPGVRVQVEHRRFYEGGALAPHVIGYVGEISLEQLRSPRFARARAGDVVGKAGVERVYEGELAGLPGKRLATVNAAGREMADLPGGRTPQAGAELELSVDLDLQGALVEAFGDRVGSGVFLDPRNGEILALASLPGFDPNLFAGRFTREEWERLARDPRHPLQNRAVRSGYSAGSTFKLVVAAAALEAGGLDPSRRIFCPGYVRMYGRRYRCHFSGGHGWVNLHQALVKSCNVYFYHLGKELGIERLADFARRLGLGSVTGVDLPGEDAGLVPDEDWSRRVRGTRWYPGETISVSIGQGPLLVTALQMAAMSGALGTGEFLPLHLVRRIGEVSAPVAEAGRPLQLSGRTLRLLRQAMRGVVHEDGTGRMARLQRHPDVEVAGKTGTVQVVKASAGVDSDELPADLRDHSWFVGYAPARRPTVAFAVFVEHGGHGGDQAAPIARKVLEVYFDASSSAPEVTLAGR